MKQVKSGKSPTPTSTDHGATPLPDHDLDALAGGGISGHKEASRLLDEHLASLDALSQRKDVTSDQRMALKASYEALLAKRLSEAIMFTP